MEQTTLCFLVRNDEVLLAMKKRGFGYSEYNGVGGKVETDEPVKGATVREANEEIGVVIA
ncbi:MAG: NUDIX domain-containing protein [Candidatus Taylorbacteria bacterium]|nr:NUDIX domain-containing protein [Candidatus Taylorbacteria bacterium]